jgi:putative ABC transport system ATP-binding protein
MTLIELDCVTRIYPRGRCVGLAEVTLAVGRGDYLALMGPSGSGKSTLLNVLCGLDPPTRGRVVFEGRPITSAREWAFLRARRIGFVFQAFNLLPTLTALQNVEVPMLGVVGQAGARRRRALELLERVGMAGRAAHYTGELAGGEKQRLAIARSLANAPDLILADEPTGNLDRRTSQAILDLLEDIHGMGTAFIIATHDNEIARRAGRIERIRDGRIETEV